MKPRAYKTPDAFKGALDQRLRLVAKAGAAITRRRQLLVFDRYLARLAQTLGDAAILKGGLVLEVRLERARTTRDIDLRLAGSPVALLERLQEAGRLDLGDFMTFEVRTDARHTSAGPTQPFEPALPNERVREEAARRRRSFPSAARTFARVTVFSPRHSRSRTTCDSFLRYKLPCCGLPARVAPGGRPR